MLPSPRPLHRPPTKILRKISRNRTNAHRNFRYKSNGWSSERRLKQSQSIRNWKPWRHSTGPRTERGKQISRDNGLKRWGPRMRRDINRLLAEHRRFITAMRQARRWGIDPESCVTSEVESWTIRVIRWLGRYSPGIMEELGML